MKNLIYGFNDRPYQRLYTQYYCVTCICVTLRGVSTLESQGLTTNTIVMLLLAMVSLHMLTFRLMVTMVAEFCSLVFLIHNTLLGEITISNT